MFPHQFLVCIEESTSIKTVISNHIGVHALADLGICWVDITCLFCHASVYLRCVMRKPVFWVSNQVGHKPGLMAKEDG